MERENRFFDTDLPKTGYSFPEGKKMASEITLELVYNRYRGET